MFTGLSAFPITPADASGRVDVDNLSILIERLVNARANSIGILGSTGTYMFLSQRERARAVAAALEAAQGKVPVIVGVGAIRTDEAIQLAKDAERRGADGVLLAPVSYTPLTDGEVFQLYQSVAQASPLPLCIYNNPGTTRFTFRHDLILRLSEIPTIQAIKMPLCSDIASEIATLRPKLSDGFALGYSGDWGIADAMIAGADSFFTAVGGLLVTEVQALMTAAAQGRADQLDAVFAPLWDLCKTHGSLRVIYAAAQQMNLTRHELPAPLLPLSSKEKDKVATALGALETIKP